MRWHQSIRPLALLPCFAAACLLASCDDEDTGARPADNGSIGGDSAGDDADATGDDASASDAIADTTADSPIDDGIGDSVSDLTADDVNIDTPSEDASADGSSDDTVGEDLGGADTATDTSEVGSGEQCPGGSDCDDLEGRLECLWDLVSECERPTECALRYNPACPLGGCFTFHGADAELAELSALETAWDDAECATAVCRCAAPPETFSCNDGVCGACPETCPYTCTTDCECYVDACGCDQPFCMGVESCQDQVARLEQAAEDMAGCSSDDQCAWTTSPLCPELGCALPINTSTSAAQLQALVTEYLDNGCGGAQCFCIPPPEGSVVECVEGRCQFAPVP